MPGQLPYGLGITPIYMGSTVYFVGDLMRAKDHPHIHGEHPLLNRLITLLLGSPPYTWGAPVMYSMGWSCIGITPIYMGSTITLNQRLKIAWDHPHIHGEHWTFYENMLT